MFCSLALLLNAAMLASDTAVVCPMSLRPALAPWVEYRAGQGHDIVLVAGENEREIGQRLREAARRHELKFLLLVGDAQANGPSRQELTPTHKAPAKVIRLLGEDKDIATDNPYADLDGDGLPDLAVGRLPADSPEDLAAMVGKILAFERAEAETMARRRIDFVAGVGGFGRLADAALETCTRRLISDKIPADFATTMTYASWTSPFFPAPGRFHEAVVERLTAGSLFWVYIGHGQRRHLDWVRTPDDRFHHILAAGDAAKLAGRPVGPIALFLACYVGAFDEPEDSLAEELLRAPGGPVAAVCGSRVTMPYAMGVMGANMLRECFVHRRETIGEVLLYAKRGLLSAPRDDDVSRALDFLASALNIHGDLAAERAEHVLLFNLLGDPLLRIPLPERIALATPVTARAGETINVHGASPIPGAATVELVLPRDRLAFSPAPRRQYSGDATMADEMHGAYQRANDRRLSSVEATVADGRLHARLRIPPYASGPCHVRVFVQGEGRVAIGSAPLEIEAATAQTAPAKD